MARKVVRDDGVRRRALIAAAERSERRWGVPGQPNESLEALRSGEPVVVDSACLLTAFSRAGLPHGDFCFGGRHWSSAFVLDEHDQLSEVDV